jgi:hypothetical protein
MMLLACNVHSLVLTPALRTPVMSPAINMDIVMKAKQPRNDKWFGTAADVMVPDVMPKTAAEVYDVDVTEAADEIASAMETPAKPKAKMPDSEAIEDAAIGVFKFMRKAVQGLADINEEYDLIGKAKEVADQAKGAAAAAIEFEKENELLIKTRAALEVGVDELKGMKKTKPVPVAADEPPTGARKGPKKKGWKLK